MIFGLSDWRGMLPTTRLGRSSLHITRVGIGAWAFGGSGWVDSWGAQDDADSVAAIRHSVESGVNWLDTAPIYGLGHSEEVVGQALREIPQNDRPYVFTKAGVIWDEHRPMDKPTLVGDPSSLRRELDASLRRLGVNRIDLYQMHAPPADGTPIEEYWSTFCEFREAGKVRALGLSNHSVAQLDAAQKVGRVDAVQPQLSLIHREAAADVLPWCTANGAGAIVYSPLASGLLSGTFTAARAAGLDADDWRRDHPDFTEPALSRNLALVDALMPVAQRHGVSVAAVAVAWTLAVRSVTGAIVGLRHRGQLDAWLAAASVQLDESDLTEIADAIDRTGAGTGPAQLK
jgi:aryl-alcohol dehydrogenase-like predicted oxidoreductase